MEHRDSSNETNEPVSSQQGDDSATAEPIAPSSSNTINYFWLVIGLHLLIVLINLVPVFAYFQRSWELEHYQFFPIALLVFGFVVWTRLERGVLRENRMVPVFCSGFLLIGGSGGKIAVFSDECHSSSPSWACPKGDKGTG